ncbi:TetR family transcriptional regulator [Yinghuangia seranimata]|uniref:TetR family transcriptional regulator n=1 Tax=Yinghuangia seranimata TaxID=408067 RepID=UPI00248B9E31|nr:TetR family transcriptional regulator [Yinghuangia seranimata]MDI2125763.1 TetR family transcriptional regulator [Yinghuangia seranimata]
MTTTARRGPGRPSLTERRREDTRTEVSRVAARLFTERGYDATTVEDIAAGSGMALRTFYRYFRAKEETLAPLFAAATRDWVDRLADCPPELGLVDALLAAYRASVRHSRVTNGIDEAQLRALLRMMEGHPAFRATWLVVHRDSEDQLRPVIAARVGAAPDDLAVRLAAGTANTAVRIAMERWAVGEASVRSAEEAVAQALREVASGGLLAP